jgi:uncharacterized protein (TIGR03437 family)
MTKLVLMVFAGAAGLLAQAPTVMGVVNVQVQTSTVLCPGLLASIYGTGFGSGATSSVVVLVGGKNALVEAVTPQQINVQLPFDVPIGATTVVVTTGGGTSAPFNVTISAVAPTLFLAPKSTTIGLIATLKGTFLSSTNLANPGDQLVLYAIGLGATNPAVPAGLAPSTIVQTATLPTLTVGGVDATVSFAGLSPGEAGLYQINFTVPAGVQGNAPVVLSIGGQSSNSVSLPLTGISAITNGASFLNTGTAAPEEIISLFANGLGSTNDLSGVFPATSAQGVSVTFNGIAAPIFALAATGSQINLIVPAELPPTGTVQVQLTTPTGTAVNFPLIMETAVPGIFLTTDPSNAKAQIAAAQFANTVWLVVPTSTATALQIPQNCTVSKANPLSICGQPAAPGDTLVVYLTGLGEATPNGDPKGTPLATGVIAPVSGSPLYETIATPTVQLGGVAVTPLFSGIAPGTAGEYQIDFQVPTGVPEGDAVPLTVAMPGSTTGTATLAIHSR